VTPLWFPQAYIVWAQLGLEIVTTIFWLSTFALLAEEAAAWDVFGDFGGLGIGSVYPKYNSAIAATKAAAGLGALVWLSFVVTLIVFGTYFLFTLTLVLFGTQQLTFLSYRLEPPQVARGQRYHWLRNRPRTSRRREGEHCHHDPAHRTEPCPATAGVCGSYCLNDARILSIDTAR
jgi:hypothetical protein